MAETIFLPNNTRLCKNKADLLLGYSCCSTHSHKQCFAIADFGVYRHEGIVNSE
jgi:hypothetical protein